MPTVHYEVSRLGGSSFLTEFGICIPNSDVESIGTVECEFVMQEADDYLQSWTYWDSTFFNDSNHGHSQLCLSTVSRLIITYLALRSSGPCQDNGQQDFAICSCL